jgi:hypothetical protein
MTAFIHRRFAAAALLAGGICVTVPAHAGEQGWRFSMTTYSWLPWITGDLGVASRDLDVDVNPGDVLNALDWSTLPVWMSYAELKNGRLTLFNDTIWTALEGSAGFESSGPLGLGASADVDYTQLTMEFGAAYTVWSDGETGAPGVMNFDLLAGARYWRQDVDIAASIGGLTAARSGQVDWVDPIVGARLGYGVAPGQSVLLRGDIGGFGAGSEFSWQALATYNSKICDGNGYTLDGFVGYRALAVDYGQGSGVRRYEMDTIQHGPVMGLTVRF